MTSQLQVLAPLILRDLRLEVLANCGLKCRHCSAFAAPNNPRFLPLEKVLNLVDQFVELGGERLTITGGEPLIYQELPLLVQHAKRANLTVRLFSSGTVLSAEGNAVAVDLGGLIPLQGGVDEIVFSVYSADPEVHDGITTVVGSHAMTLQAIEQCQHLGIRVSLHYVPTKYNYKDLDQLVAWAKRNNIPKVQVLRFVPHGRGLKISDTLALTPSDWTAFHFQLQKLRQGFPTVQLKMGSAHNALALGDASPCTAAVDQMNIDVLGNVAPCSGFGDFHRYIEDPFGNVLHHSLAEVWTQSSYLNGVRQLVESAGCGGCPAQASIAQGQLSFAHLDPLMLWNQQRDVV